jgi:hypothetical protein
MRAFCRNLTDFQMRVASASSTRSHGRSPFSRRSNSRFPFRRPPRNERMLRGCSRPVSAAMWRAYQRDNFVLFEGFPEVRAFMNRRSGYPVLLDALSLTEATSEGAGALAPFSELARRHRVSRTLVRKLFSAARSLATEFSRPVIFYAQVRSVLYETGPRRYTCRA